MRKLAQRITTAATVLLFAFPASADRANRQVSIALSAGPPTTRPADRRPYTLDDLLVERLRAARTDPLLAVPLPFRKKPLALTEKQVVKAAAKVVRRGRLKDLPVGRVVTVTDGIKRWHELNRNTSVISPGAGVTVPKELIEKDAGEEYLKRIEADAPGRSDGRGPTEPGER